MDSSEIMARAAAYARAEKHEVFRREVEALVKQNDMEQLRDRFYTDLAFGTGGLRGVIGGGSNRMNPHTVRMATQGVANYIKKTVSDRQASVVIAFDSRHYSDAFALEAAEVLCGNAIRTYLFTGLRPTPELSFAVRYLRATAGIVVTASHNPPEYNGYKVYWSDGGQIVAPHDTGIIAEARSVAEIKSLDGESARKQGLLVMIDREVDDAYIAMVKGLAIRPDLIRRQGKALAVVYTPLHGSGGMPLSRTLSELGIEVIFVAGQKEPDVDFPTVSFPNPDEAAALAMAIDLGKKVKADLVMATDPDADRLGIAVPRDGEYELVTGNQLGALLADYIFSGRKEEATLPAKPAFVKTIVTTELQRRIAESYGALCFDVLTGFKYIARKIQQLETEDQGVEYVFGGEESYGYLVGTAVRDKDAVSAAAMTAEMALYHRSQGRTVLDQLDSIYRRYGYFQEMLISKYFKGEQGLEIMRGLMQRLRHSPPVRLGGQAVRTVKDYADGTVLDVGSGMRKKQIELPSSDVLQFILSDGSVVTARPSGTEPKIKFYASCSSEPGEDLLSAKDAVGGKVKAIQREINQLIGE